MRGRICAGFVLSVTVLSAQQVPPTTHADVARGLAAAERLLQEDKLEEANAQLRVLVDAAHRLGLDAEEAQAVCDLGQTLEHQSRYSEAEVTLRQCLEMAERTRNGLAIGRALFLLSRTADVAGRSAEAISLASRSIAAYDAIPNPAGAGAARIQLLHLQRPPLDETRAITARVVEDARRAGNPGLEADAVHGLGDRLFAAGRFEEALDVLTNARELNHEAGRFGAEGTVLNSLGRLYRAHGRLDEALKCQQQALALHEKYGTPLQLMQSHNAVAVVEEFSGDLTAARDHYERALAIARQASSQRIQDFLDANIAALLITLGEYEKGVHTLEGVIARGLDTNTTMRYENLVDAYIRLHRLADALDAGNHAVALCGDDSYACINAFDNRAAAYAALNDLPEARADLRKAVDAIERVRSRLVPADRLKQNFQDAQRGIYSTSIALALRQQDVRDALGTAEIASSRAFLDLLEARRQQPGTPGDDAAVVFRGGSGVGGRDLLSRATAAPASADDLVAIAQRLRSTLVEYWPSDDRLFIWVVKGDGTIVAREAPVPSARLLEWIRTTAPAPSPSREQERPMTTRGEEALESGNPAAPRPWRQLYDALIAPIRDQLPSAPGSLLTIVPHGVLMTVSFAALQARDGRYLLEDYALNYAPAGAVLQFTAGMRRADARQGAALLVADPVTVRRSPLDPPLPPLPGARLEVGQIARLIPRSRVTVLMGGDASEPRVTSTAPSKAIVHLATHAIVRDDAPNDSYLAFAVGDASKTGMLTARDVYDLRLNADLVVLSACRSGGGRVTGDGIAAFARAFIYAGTPSLVVSLWDVADEPTSRLLPAFYRGWLAGASKAQSLRRAQLQLLADLRAGKVRVDTKAGPVVLPEHPVFWAGFVLIGEPE